MACEDCEPCPWCGGEIELEEFGGGDDYWWGHFCENRDHCGWQSWMGRNTCPVCQENIREAVPEWAMCILSNRPEIEYPRYKTYTFCSSCTERHKKLLGEYNSHVHRLAEIGYELAYLAADEGQDVEMVQGLWKKYVHQELGEHFLPFGIVMTARWIDEKEKDEIRDDPSRRWH